MKTRAAVAFEAKQPLEIVELDLEGPKAGEVLVEVMATGICHTDAYTLDGLDSEGQEREFEGGDDDDDDEEDEEEEEGGSDEESVSVCDQRRSPLQKTPLPLPPASATRIRALVGGLSIFTANLLILPPEGVVELALTSTGTRALRAHYQSRTVCLRPLFPSSSCTGRETRLTVG